MTDAAIYRARAEECEHLAHTQGYEKQRDMLLDIASKWRKLAAQVEADDKSGKGRKKGDSQPRD